jgi:hypothetical protein
MKFDKPNPIFSSSLLNDSLLKKIDDVVLNVLSIGSKKSK